MTTITSENFTTVSEFNQAAAALRERAIRGMGLPPAARVRFDQECWSLDSTWGTRWSRHSRGRTNSQDTVAKYHRAGDTDVVFRLNLTYPGGGKA